jgi:hypothetical protein
LSGKQLRREEIFRAARQTPKSVGGRAETSP